MALQDDLKTAIINHMKAKIDEALKALPYGLPAPLTGGQWQDVLIAAAEAAYQAAVEFEDEAKDAL